MEMLLPALEAGCACLLGFRMSSLGELAGIFLVSADDALSLASRHCGSLLEEISMLYERACDREEGVVGR